MLAPVVIVRKDAADAAALAHEIRSAGHGAAEFTDPFAFLGMLMLPGAADAVEVLVTDAVFAAGQPHGFSIANMLALRRRNAQTVFVGPPEFEGAAKGVGEHYVSLPTSTSHLCAVVVDLLDATSCTVRAGATG